MYSRVPVHAAYIPPQQVLQLKTPSMLVQCESSLLTPPISKGTVDKNQDIEYFSLQNHHQLQNL